MIDPAAQPAPVAPDPTSAPAPEQADTGGFCVELYVSADGTMSVSVEPGKTAPDGGEDPEAGGQPVANIGEAMKLIREIVMHGGEPTDMAASQNEMSAGYGKDGM